MFQINVFFLKFTSYPSPFYYYTGFITGSISRLVFILLVKILKSCTKTFITLEFKSLNFISSLILSFLYYLCFLVKSFFNRFYLDFKLLYGFIHQFAGQGYKTYHIINVLDKCVLFSSSLHIHLHFIITQDSLLARSQDQSFSYW